jgi:hypothetical protein
MHAPRNLASRLAQSEDPLMPTIRGRVSGRPGTLLFVDAMLEVGGRKTTARAAPADHLVLRTDDDLEVRVEGIAKAKKSGRISLSGRYGELVEHPICAAFAHAAPGDHVAASIVGFAIAAGDVVTIEGDVLEEQPSRADGKEGGFRVAPARVSAVVRASRITIDGGAADPVEHAPSPSRALRVRYPLETSTWVHGAMAVLLLSGWLVGAPVLHLVAEPAWLTPALGAGLAFALTAVNRFVRARWHASYVTQIGGPRMTEGGAIWGYQADKYVIGGYVFMSWWSIIDSRAATVMTALLSLFGVLHAALAAWNDRAFRRFAATVLGASPRDPASGRMVLVEGRLVEPELALRRQVEFSILEAESQPEGSDEAAPKVSYYFYPERRLRPAALPARARRRKARASRSAGRQDCLRSEDAASAGCPFPEEVASDRRPFALRGDLAAKRARLRRGSLHPRRRRCAAGCRGRGGVPLRVGRNARRARPCAVAGARCDRGRTRDRCDPGRRGHRRLSLPQIRPASTGGLGPSPLGSLTGRPHPHRRCAPPFTSRAT